MTARLRSLRAAPVSGALIFDREDR
jgi:hypothetical protein